MSISRSSVEAATFCDGEPCSGDVVHLTAFDGYNDRKRPAKVTILWDAVNRGRGVNSNIYKRGDAANSPRQILPACVKAPKIGYTNLPCVAKRKQLKNGDVQFLLLILSGDPKFARK